MPRTYTDGEKAAAKHSRAALRSGYDGGSLGLGLRREVAALLPTLVAYLNDGDNQDLREELRRTVREIQAGRYVVGSFPEARVTLDFRLAKRDDRYEVLAEVVGNNATELMQYALLEALRCGDLERVVICRRCDRVVLRTAAAEHCSDTCRIQAFKAKKSAARAATPPASNAKRQKAWRTRNPLESLNPRKKR